MYLYIYMHVHIYTHLTGLAVGRHDEYIYRDTYVYIHVYVHIYKYTYICTYKHTYWGSQLGGMISNPIKCIYMYIYLCIYAYISICKYIYIHRCKYIHVCIYIHIYWGWQLGGTMSNPRYICICIYIYIYICIYIFAYMYIFAYIYISTGAGSWEARWVIQSSSLLEAVFDHFPPEICPSWMTSGTQTWFPKCFVQTAPKKKAHGLCVSVTTLGVQRTKCNASKLLAHE